LTTTNIEKKHKYVQQQQQEEDIFILCETCHWCATYLDKSRLLHADKCPMCLKTEISSFPILPNESFTFDYTQRHGVELEFKPRKKKTNNKIQ
jgi:hypothetical protein